MASDSLNTDVSTIHSRYRAAFAGRSRASRDASLLKQLIQELEGVVPRIPAQDELRRNADENLRIYREELRLIEEIQAGGPQVIAAWRLVEWSELGRFRYAREYAGQNRSTRDLALLRELANEQRNHIGGIGANITARDARLAEQKTDMERQLSLYEGELTAIPAARAALSTGDHAKVLAGLANRQFSLYRTHFAEKSRASRRPALLRRIMGALEEIARGMEALRDLGLRTQPHLENIQKVRERIDHHRRELNAVEQAHAQTAPATLVGLLGDDANRVFNAYRQGFAGKKRADVSLENLSELCDQLHEIARNMQETQVAFPTDSNAKNLGIVLDTLKQYEREYEEIRKAKK